MEATIKFITSVDDRLIIEVDTTFPAYNKDGEECTTNQFSIGMKSGIIALSDTPIGAVINAKCAGRPAMYEGVDSALIFALFGARIVFDRTKLDVGQKRIDGTPVEKPCHQTVIKSIITKADLSMLMTLVSSIRKKEVSTNTVNPFK